MPPSHKFRAALLGITFIFGGMIGVPIPPEKIRELMQQASQPKIAHTLPAENESGDALLKRLLRRMGLRLS